MIEIEEKRLRDWLETYPNSPFVELVKICQKHNSSVSPDDKCENLRAINKALNGEGIDDLFKRADYHSEINSKQGAWISAALLVLGLAMCCALGPVAVTLNLFVGVAILIGVAVVYAIGGATLNWSLSPAPTNITHFFKRLAKEISPEQVQEIERQKAFIAQSQAMAMMAMV